MAQITAALFSFVDTPYDQRPGVSLFVDEFQNFTTRDFEKLLTEGRKYGLRIVMAHQFRDQLPPYLKKSTITARTIVCFHTTPDDATEMAKEFPGQGGEFAISRRATKDLLDQVAELPPVVTTFVETYLRSVPKGSGDVKIRLPDDLSTYHRVNGTKPKRAPVTMPNPIGHLDKLFYQVMQSGNPSLPIPENAIYGLANGGIGFYDGISRTSADILTCDVRQLPRHLVVARQDGSFAWTRTPEDGKEQLLHCIFHLRMTMHYLAAHPVGKEESAGSSNVASMLTQLPPRAAFVKSDKDIGVIFTHDAPRQLSGSDLERRVRSIRDQTRAAYCLPKSQVEATITGAPAMGGSTELDAEWGDEVVSLRDAVDGEIKLRAHGPLQSDTPITRWEEVDE
jgi:hypothetical protein